MTKLLDEAIERARRLPSNRQDEAARILMNIVEREADAQPRLTEEQAAVVRDRLGSRAYATDEEVAAFFRNAGA